MLYDIKVLVFGKGRIADSLANELASCGLHVSRLYLPQEICKIYMAKVKIKDSIMDFDIVFIPGENLSYYNMSIDFRVSDIANEIAKKGISVSTYGVSHYVIDGDGKRKAVSIDPDVQLSVLGYDNYFGHAEHAEDAIRILNNIDKDRNGTPEESSYIDLGGFSLSVEVTENGQLQFDRSIRGTGGTSDLSRALVMIIQELHGFHRTLTTSNQIAEFLVPEARDVLAAKTDLAIRLSESGVLDGAFLRSFARLLRKVGKMALAQFGANILTDLCQSLWEAIEAAISRLD